MRRIYTILHLYLMVAISLHLLWLMSKTTKRPTTSEFLQLFRTSAKFFQSACFAILYQAFRDAPHSVCLAVASLILNGRVKSGQRWSGQNRPTDVARDSDVLPCRLHI